jgi:hypothetical protein
MKSRESVPLEGRLGHPYYSPRARLHTEKGSPDRVVMSPREREASKLGLQASMSGPVISACSGVVVIMVLLPHHGMAWRDATVPTMTVLLAWW